MAKSATKSIADAANEAAGGYNTSIADAANEAAGGYNTVSGSKKIYPATHRRWGWAIVNAPNYDPAVEQQLDARLGAVVNPLTFNEPRQETKAPKPVEVSEERLERCRRDLQAQRELANRLS